MDFLNYIKNETLFMRKYNSECMGFHVNIENKTLFYHIFDNPNIFRTFVEIKNKLVIFTPFCCCCC